MSKSRRRPQTSQGRPVAQRATAAAATSTDSGTSPAPATTRPAVAASPPLPDSDPRAAERIQRQRERAEARRKAEQMRRLRTALVIGAAVLLVGGGLAWVLFNNANNPPIGQSVSIVGADHIEPPARATGYNSVPPTSGSHYPNPATAGVYEQPVQDEVQVHNLEHGQIMVQYTCTDCPEIVASLKGIAARYRQWVLVAPYPDPDARVGAKIVLTAWGYIHKMNEYREQEIIAFIDQRKNRGPENVIRE